MRRFATVLIASLGLALAGCESMDSLPSRVRERFEPVQAQVREFPGDTRTVFFAAQAAMRRIDFQLTRTAQARGIVDGRSALHSGETFGKAQQYTLSVRIEEGESGRTQVSAVLRSQEESDSFAGATDVPLRQHGLYEAFFAALEQVLKEGFAPPPAPGK